MLFAQNTPQADSSDYYFLLEIHQQYIDETELSFDDFYNQTIQDVEFLQRNHQENLLRYLCENYEIDNNCTGCDFEEAALITTLFWTGDFGVFQMEQDSIVLVGNEQCIHDTLTQENGEPSLHFQLVPQSFDPYVSIETVPCLPPENQQAIRLGSPGSTGALAEVLTKTITVTEEQNTFSFEFAAVFENPEGHPILKRPAFRVEIRNAVDNTDYSEGRVDLGNGSNEIISNNVLLQSNDDFKFIDWSCVIIDLNGLEDRTVNINFINRDCALGGHFGYTYLDNFQNASCSELDQEPSLSLNNASYDVCSCEGQICVDYQLPQATFTDSSLVEGELTIILNISQQLTYNNPGFNFSLSSELLNSGNQYCFDLAQVEGLGYTLSGFDFNLNGIFEMGCYNLIPVALGNDGTGQDELYNNDILLPPCPEPTLQNMNEDVCTVLNNGFYTNIIHLDLDGYETNIAAMKLWQVINEGQAAELANWSYDANGNFELPVSFLPLDCPLDCQQPYLKYTTYQFFVTFDNFSCLREGNVQDTSDVLSVNVFPPLQEAAVYNTTTHPDCARENIIIETVKPCYGGSNGAIKIDVSCIIGGTQNLSNCFPNGIYSFRLYKDEVFNFTWEADCREFVGSLDYLTCGIANFDDNTKMYQGDYLLEVTSEWGCEETIEILIPLEQLNPVDVAFIQKPYYWCSPEYLTIEIAPDLGSAYTYHWDRAGENGVHWAGETPNKLTLNPYACAGGKHIVNITRLATDGSQSCSLTDTVIVVDFNPPPLVLQQYEDALAIAAAKYRSIWLNDFNDVQMSAPENLENLRNRNPYATSQAGVFRPYQVYDYLDNRRQFIDRQGNEVSNPILNNETETILQTDGVIGMPNIAAQTLVKGFSWNHPNLQNCAPEWKFNNEITKYNPYNFDTEHVDVLDRYTASLYGYDGQLVTAVAANARYREIAFESFEEYTPNALDASNTNSSSGTYLLPGKINPQTERNIEQFSIFPLEGTATIEIEVHQALFNCTFVPSGNIVMPPTISLFIGSDMQDAVSKGVLWQTTLDNLNAYTEYFELTNIPVAYNDKLFVGFSGRFRGACQADPGIIQVTWSIPAVGNVVHQFNNTTGNFDFVNFNKIGTREYLDPIAVLSGFGKHAVIDLPYSAVCEGENKMTVKYAAESLEFECREQNIVNEVVGMETEVTIFPDPCGTDRTMIIFDDPATPGFALYNNVQFWNGFVYPVSTIQPFNTALNLERGVNFVTEKAHTGNVSMRIDNNNDSPVAFYHPDLKLESGKEYLLSAWVHTPDFEVFSPVALRQYNLDNEIGIYIQTGESTRQLFMPKGDVIEGWQRLEATFKIPETGGGITLSFNPAKIMYLDDIRLHPVNGSMQSYVYDLQRYRLLATLDHNNYTTFYRYDDKGDLFHVAKETMDGIKTLQVNHTYLKPND